MVGLFRILISVLVIVLLIAGISEPAAAQSGAPVGIPPSPEVQSEIQSAVHAYLSGIPNAPGNPVQILSTVRRSWPDSCLGLAGRGQYCATMVIEGYQVKAAVNGLLYILRTNLTGTALGYEAVVSPTITFAPAVPASLYAIGQAAGAYLDRMLGWADSVEVVSVEASEWPDTCLGVSPSNAPCIVTVVPGYRVTLLVNGAQYIVRTDLAGALLAVDPTTPVPPVLGAPPLNSSNRIFLPVVDR